MPGAGHAAGHARCRAAGRQHFLLGGAGLAACKAYRPALAQRRAASGVGSLQCAREALKRGLNQPCCRVASATGWHTQNAFAAD